VTRVYLRHLRSQEWCLRGCRDWWKVHGFDWSDFLTNGIEADKLRGTGDAYGVKAADIAEQEAGIRG